MGPSKLNGLGLNPSGFDPTRRVHRSGSKKQTACIKGIVSSFWHGQLTTGNEYYSDTKLHQCGFFLAGYGS